MKKFDWKKYASEFLMIFVAVIAAFALTNWNDNRKASLVESKILLEILNGLEKDSLDLAGNNIAHEYAIKGGKYFRRFFSKQPVDSDSVTGYYFYLTRDVISVQNVSGYETLKSKGLEIIQNDSLRTMIISLYEIQYQIMRKFSEEYSEHKYHDNYFFEINAVLAENFIFDDDGFIRGLNQPVQLSDKKRKILLSYLWKIEINRNDRISAGKGLIRRISALKRQIELELDSR